MAKTDLLKQAIADANAVKETALANAKIALQEAFAPRIQSMLSAKLSEELEDEEMSAEDEMPADDLAGDEMGAEAEMGDAPEEVGVGLDFNMDGDYDLTGNIGAVEDEEGLPAEDEFSDEDANNEYSEEDDDLELESIIRELEGDLDESEEMPEDDELMHGMHEGEEYDVESEEMHEDIDAIIESILREEDLDVTSDVESDDEHGDVVAELAEKEEELKEAYKTVKKLTSIINEVNLLNAKLLYTNKLFRNFELNESQKMKVIENFDRAGNTREVKLVFSTLAESFTRPTTKKRVVKESYASKPVSTTAPKTQVLNEGFELANRWKKLAGLL